MESKEFWEIMYPISIALATGIAGLITYGFAVLGRYLKAKTDAIVNEDDRKFVQSFLDQIEDHIATAVGQTNQELVDYLKSASADGKLTQDEMTEAFRKTYKTARRLIGDAAYEELQQVVPDAEAWIESKIQFHVGLAK